MFLFLDFTTDMSLTLIGRHSFLSKKIKPNKNISEILVIEIEKIFNKAKINIKNNLIRYLNKKIRNLFIKFIF